jgi:hypothetical protein
MRVFDYKGTILRLLLAKVDGFQCRAPSYLYIGQRETQSYEHPYSPEVNLPRN